MKINRKFENHHSKLYIHHQQLSGSLALQKHFGHTIVLAEHGGELVPAKNSTVVIRSGVQLCHALIN